MGGNMQQLADRCRKAGLLLIGCLALASATAPLALAANGDEKSIRLYVVQQPLSSVFETLGTLAGVGVQIDPAIDRTATQVNLQGRHFEVFQQLARQYNLFYWFDGSRYSIHLPTQLARWALPVDRVADDYVNTVINHTAPYISSDSIHFNKELRIINITGPKELKDMMERNLAGYTRENQESVAIIKFGVSSR